MRRFSQRLQHIIWQFGKHLQISFQAPFTMPKTSLEDILIQQSHATSVGMKADWIG
jgi:hypothetical protein